MHLCSLLLYTYFKELYSCQGLGVEENGQSPFNGYEVSGLVEVS